jgi:hypothetical protein
VQETEFALPLLDEQMTTAKQAIVRDRGLRELLAVHADAPLLEQALGGSAGIDDP